MGARPQAEPGSYRSGLIRLGYFIISLTDFDRYLIVFLLYIIHHNVVVRKSLLLFCILLTSVASGTGTKLVVSNSDCGFSKNSVTSCFVKRLLVLGVSQSKHIALPFCNYRDR